MTRKTTAAELVARLNGNPEYVARRKAEEKERQERAAEWQRAEAPLIEELRAAGILVNSAWDLVNAANQYSQALPILVKHLQLSYPGPVREGIARALAVPAAKFGWDVLTRLYRHESDKRAKDGLAVAIAATAEDDVIDDVIGLARDVQNGPSRLLHLRALERSRAPQARATLTELRTDEELQKEIKVILRRSRHT